MKFSTTSRRKSKKKNDKRKRKSGRKRRKKKRRRKSLKKINSDIVILLINSFMNTSYQPDINSVTIDLEPQITILSSEIEALRQQNQSQL